MQKHIGRGLIFLFMLLIPLVGQAQTEVGKVIIIKGDVVAVSSQKERPLSRGSIVYDGDTIKTKAGAAAQLRMVDGAHVGLFADTEFRIDEYVYKQVGKPDTSVTTLVSGGFKTITGAIPKNNRGGYQVKTPIATMGLRGTDFAAGICSAADVAVHGCAIHSLSVGVFEGVVQIKNKVDSIEIGVGKPYHNAVIFGADRPIQGMTQQPRILSTAEMTGTKPGSTTETPAAMEIEPDFITQKGTSGGQTAPPPGSPLKPPSVIPPSGGGGGCGGGC